MEFDFSEDILEDAKELAVEMLQTGEKIREKKIIKSFSCWNPQ
jgi:hypothetical protein